MKNINLSILSLVFIFVSCNNTPPPGRAESSQLRGDYLGQSSPGEIAHLFAPEVISTGMYERDFTITPDGNDIYYSIMGRGYSVIVTCHRKNGVWSEPQIAPFSGSRQFMDAEPHISPDGKQFFFLSTRPKKGQEAKPGWVYQDIWVMDRTSQGWGEPYNLGSPVNTDKGEYFPSVTREGTLYFTREEDNRQQAIYRSRLIDGKYSEPEKLPVQINTSLPLFNAFIAPDESYLVICASLESGSIGRTDYCVSFRSDDDQWTPLINMGPIFNIEGGNAISPSITHDGKYLFFASQRRAESSDSITSRRTLTKIKEQFMGPQNGNSDIYWIETTIIEKLRPKQK